MAAPLILIEASPRSAATGAVVTTRLCGAGGSEPSYYLGQHWRRGLAGLPTIVSSTEFDGKDLGGGSVPQAMTVRWAPSSSAALAELAGLHWLDAAMTVRFGEAPSPAEITSGKVIDVSTDDGVLTLSLSDPAADLKKPILTARFAGTGGIEGPVEWQSKIKRRAWGRVWNLEGECIDAARQIYCFGDPSRPWAEISTVRDKGATAASLTLLAWQGSIAATWAALQAAVPPQGGGVVCPSIACVKWWTQPAGSLCADIKGEIGAAYVETAPAIAERIAATVSAIPFAAGTVAAAVAARPAEVGWVAADETGTAAAALDALLSDVSLMWVLDAGGIVLRVWAWGAPVVRARSVDVVRKAMFRPVSRRRLGYRRNQHVMARDALAGIVLATDVVFGDGSTAVNLQAAVVQAQSTADTAKGAADAAQGSANTAVNALKDASGNLVPVRDQIAAAKAALEQAIAQAQSDIAAAQATIASINGSVNGLVTTSIPNLTQRITSAEGVNTSQGQLLTTYGTQISTVTSQASTTAGNLATLIQTVQAGNMNLVKNGGFENGTANWNASPGSVWGVSTSDIDGRHAYCNNPPSGAWLYSDPIPVLAGRQYTLSFRARVLGSGASIYGSLAWYDAAGNLLTPQGVGPVRSAPLGFLDAGNRQGSVLTATAPVGAVAARAQIVGQNLPSTGQVAAQQVKLELGSVATPYTSEASVAQAFTAITTANEQVAQLSTTLSTQSTSISSLQTATSTLQGDMATVQTRLVAGNPNLLPNGGFENGLASWVPVLGNWIVASQNVWGSYVYWGGTGAQTTGERYVILDHEAVQMEPNTPFCFSCDLNVYNSTGNAYARLEVLVYSDQAKTNLLQLVPGPNITQPLFSTTPGQNRRALVVTGTTPSNGWWVVCRIVGCGMTNGVGSANGVSVRQCKLERGNVPTTYTGETSLLLSYTAISTLDGQRVTMQSQINTQGSSISSLQSVTSTLQGNVAQITQRLSAGSPNLLPNGGFENGMQGWNPVIGGWQNLQGSWGSYVGWTGSGATTDGERYVILDSAAFPVDGGAPFVLSADADVWNYLGNAYCRVEVGFYSNTAATTEIGRAWGPNITQPSFWNEPGYNRGRLALYGTTPSGTVRAVVRLVGMGMYAGSNSGSSFRQVKFERGTSLTPYSSEASIIQTFQALTTVNQQYASLSSTVSTQGATISSQQTAITTLNNNASAVNQQYASLSNTVSTQGVTISSQQTAITTLNNNVSTVFGQWVLDIDVNGRVSGIKLANSGSSSSLRFRADLVSFESPSGGYRTEYSNGGWRTYNAANIIVYEDGVYS